MLELYEDNRSPELMEASEKANLALEEEQIRVDTDNVPEGESPLGSIAEKWTVTMDVAKESEADQILQAWSEDFNKQPYFPTASKVPR